MTPIEFLKAIAAALQKRGAACDETVCIGEGLDVQVIRAPKSGES
jgi:hypothetical protein